jgi:hypothetical protein
VCECKDIFNLLKRKNLVVTFFQNAAFDFSATTQWILETFTNYTNNETKKVPNRKQYFAYD